MLRRRQIMLLASHNILTGRPQAMTPRGPEHATCNRGGRLRPDKGQKTITSRTAISASVLTLLTADGNGAVVYAVVARII